MIFNTFLENNPKGFSNKHLGKKPKPNKALKFSIACNPYPDICKCMPKFVFFTLKLT